MIETLTAAESSPSSEIKAAELPTIELTIPSAWKTDLESEIKRINKRLTKKGIAERIGIVGISDPYLRSYGDRRSPITGEYPKIEAIDLVVSLPELRLSGEWRLIGALDHESGDRPIVKAIEGETLPAELRSVSPDRCDHCNSRRFRKDTFAIRSAAGELAIVGRNCIAAYLGIDPSSALYLFDLRRKLRERYADPESEYMSGRAELAYSFGSFLTAGACFIRKNGYLSKRAAEINGGDPTASVFWFALNDPEDRAELKQTEDQDRELAKAAEAWIKSLPSSELDRSEYLYNLRVIADSGRVTRKTAGYAVSLIPSYQRTIERDREREAERKAGESSNHVGTIGERVRDLTLTINGIRELESMYGISYLVRMSDPAGNLLVWFASSDPRERQGIELGGSYPADCTIKDHSSFRGTKQTKVNRVSFQTVKA